jgi:hypothetical protein
LIARALHIHRARASLTPLAVLPWVIYRALPLSLPPLLILLPGVALLGVGVCIAAATFKKFLLREFTVESQGFLAPPPPTQAFPDTMLTPIRSARSSTSS